MPTNFKKKLLALSLSDVVFIMLINVKMPTIYEQDKFRAQQSWAWKKFHNLGGLFGLKP